MDNESEPRELLKELLNTISTLIWILFSNLHLLLVLGIIFLLLILFCFSLLKHILFSRNKNKNKSKMIQYNNNFNQNDIYLDKPKLFKEFEMTKLDP